MDTSPSSLSPGEDWRGALLPLTGREKGGSSRRMDAATQCCPLMCAKSATCVFMGVSKLSQCDLKMVSQSTQTGRSKSTEIAIEAMWHPADGRGLITKNTGQASPCQSLPAGRGASASMGNLGDKPTRKQQYKCNYCNKAFTCKTRLEDHLPKHTGARPYQCEHCKTRFTLKCNLKTHLSIHTGDRPYRCDVCGSAFRIKVQLVRHERIHTGEKPYQCQLCPMAFVQHSALGRHLRSHTGEKRYQCKVCQKAFMYNRSLKHHMEVNHERDSSE